MSARKAIADVRAGIVVAGALIAVGALLPEGAWGSPMLQGMGLGVLVWAAGVASKVLAGMPKP